MATDYSQYWNGISPGYKAPDLTFNTDLGDFAGLTLDDPVGVLGTFANDPRGLWETAQYQGLGSRAFNPMFQSTIGQGFTPAYGGFLLRGGQDWNQFDTTARRGNPFAQYLSKVAPVTTGARQAQIANDWQQALAASRYMAGVGAGTIDPLSVQGEPGYAPLGNQAQTIQSFIEADPRSSAIAMSLAQMGGGVGALGASRQRYLGNLYDIYAARARGAGDVEYGFLDYLDRMSGPGGFGRQRGTVIEPPITGGDEEGGIPPVIVVNDDENNYAGGVPRD